MNEYSTKKIFFNRSTLLSLKAELLKKQEEVNEKKQLPQHKIENFQPAPVNVSNNDNHNKSDKEIKRSLKDKLVAVDTEELEACRKAKLALEKKAELYEHLSDTTGNSQLAGRFLVDFNTKKLQNEEREVYEASPAKQEAHNSSEENWAEFTDCLGRTRKCHRSDLEWYKQKDLELMKVMNKDDSSKDDSEDLKKTEKPFLVQKTNDYLQSLRKKWEEKEHDLLAKDKDIHYQDLLFDEARIHGVGYFSFSTDETERQKQMDELKKLREETMRKQQEAEEVRKKRDELMAARVTAARARQRARAGLPPEEPKENTKDFTACLLEFLTQQKNEADAKAKEEEKKLKEEQEKERLKLREAYVREWDIGKSGVECNSNKFYEMSQEEYVEQQRNKRINEFAPTQTSSNDHFDHTFDNKGRSMSDQSTKSKTWSEVRPIPKTPLPSIISETITRPEEKGLYFSSAKKDLTLKYKNFVKGTVSTPIVNELSDEDSNIISEKGVKRMRESNEIAPPPTYEYYGPVPNHKKSKKPFESDIREAYAQGAKSLEPKSSYRQLPKHYDFTFD